MSHETLKTDVLYAGWGRYLQLALRLPDGTRVTREVEDHGDAVAVLPYDPERRTATLVSLFRAPPFLASGATALLEVPAGLLDEPDPAAGARREALEEVGLALGPLEPVGEVWTMPGISTERMHLFLAAHGAAERVAPGGGLAEEHENITVVELPLAELARRADEGSLNDLKTLLLVQTLRLRRPELF